MKSGALDLSHKSYIGAIPRRSELAAERIHIRSRGVLSEVKGRHGPTVPAVNLTPFMPIYRDTFGSPSQNPISKLCSSVTHITSQVKSASSISSLSTILTLL